MRGRLAAPDHVGADTRFADVDAEPKQFAADVRRSPQWIFPAQQQDQLPHSFGTASPPRPPRRIFQCQNKPKPLQCQPIIVAALTGRGPDSLSARNREQPIQRKRSAAVSLGRWTERWRTPI